MLTCANHLGLYAEQTGHSGEALGNFPQAFTHMGLISAAFPFLKEIHFSRDGGRTVGGNASILTSPRATLLG
jgi:hypothetical protein